MLKNGKTVPIWKKAIILFVLIAFASVNTLAFAATDSECAEVKIVINQKLSFERQAFDAKIVISNGLSSASLQNIDIQLIFLDRNKQPVIATQDPNAAEALFFYRTDSSTGIDSWNGNGTIQNSSKAEIHWLIIPTSGAAGSDALGNIYYVGANVTYTLEGKTSTVTVNPDYIMVKPLPELTLDYFLPKDVYGDDPFTSEIEPIIPFHLGVRIKNDGLGVSKNTQIESAQVKIVENKQGLLVDYGIQASFVGNQRIKNSLLLEFGDVLSNQSQVGRWIMTSSLSGEFTKFDATFTHADNLGGALTSVIKAVNTHTLIHDVRVDLPGRDDALDFLAKDVDVFRVYESEGIDTVVNDLSAGATISYNEHQGELHFPQTAGFVYAKISDPWQGRVDITQIQRNDGKTIPAENIWFSKTRDKNDLSWHYFINIFDFNSTGWYEFNYIKKHDPEKIKDIHGRIYSTQAGGFNFANIAVTLAFQNNANGTIESWATLTDVNGEYEFKNLIPGTYSLQIEPLDISIVARDGSQEFVFNKHANDIITFTIKDDLAIEIASSNALTLSAEVK